MIKPKSHQAEVKILFLPLYTAKIWTMEMNENLKNNLSIITNRILKCVQAKNANPLKKSQVEATIRLQLL